MTNLFFPDLVILTIYLVPNCGFAVPINDAPNDSSIISTQCDITPEIEGYCVSIKNCLSLIKLNRTDLLLARQCGPSNENVKQPKVCCEPSSVQFEESQSVSVTPGPAEICGIQNIGTRLVGGETSAKKQFPWLARLLRKDTFGDLLFSCTGALISSRVVLTTAHCLVSEKLVEVGEMYAVSLGVHDTECTSNECVLTKKTAVVSKCLPHPSYDNHDVNHHNDIGLIITRDKVQFTPYITPICLLRNNFEPKEYHVAGWGKTEIGKTSKVKLNITLPPYSWEQCVKKYRTINVDLTEKQICAGGEEGVDSCQGDSGGPLMVQLADNKWYVAGIVSFGVRCGSKGWPGIYVYVPSYIAWIQENIRKEQTLFK